MNLKNTHVALFLSTTHTSSMVPRSQPRERIGTMPSTSRKALKVLALITHMPRHLLLLLLLLMLLLLLLLLSKWIPTHQVWRHGGTPLRHLLRLLVHLLRGGTILRQRLEWSLWGHLRIVVQGQY